MHICTQTYIQELIYIHTPIHTYTHRYTDAHVLTIHAPMPKQCLHEHTHNVYMGVAHNTLAEPPPPVAAATCWGSLHMWLELEQVPQ